MNSGIGKLVDSLALALLPPPALLVSEWARQKFSLSSEYSATKGHFEPYPYQLEPLDVLSPSNPADTICLMCGAQMMKTLIMLIFLAYVIDVDPGPVLIVQPNAEDAESFSKERLAPMIEDVPAVREKVHQAKSRDGGNTIQQKRFRGGSVSLTGTVSPRGLRRRSVRYLMCDEVDGYQETSDGDPLPLAAARTSKFWNRKIILCSTPTIEGISRIAKAYEDSDQRRYFVPCPYCDHYQTLEWSGVRWGDVDGTRIEPADAHYQCCECGKLIPHYRKLEMLRAGKWAATNPEGKYPGFQISRLCAPDWSWGRIVTDPLEGFLAAKGNPSREKTFKNNILAETWKERGEAPDHEKLMARREESYRLGQVPPEVLFLTAGVDVQSTWIEGYVWGWGRERQRWVIDRFRIENNPYDVDTWAALDSYLFATYKHTSGADLSLIRLAIDTGHATQQVYAWARQHGVSRVLAIDGRASGAALLGMPSAVDVTVGGRKIKSGAKLWPVNVSMAKSELYGLLAKERPADGEPYPAGWVHFPADMDEEFFKQLTAEHLVTRVVKGYRKTEWQKTRERNEALDCANYARAAAIAFGIDRFREQDWAALERQLGMPASRHQEPDVEPAQITASAPVPPRAVPQRRVFRSSYMSRS